MRVLFDIVHPAHVHFFRHLYGELIAEGHEARVISRDKDVTLALLDRFGIPHLCVDRARTGSLIERGAELVRRVLALRREIRAFQPDIVLTRNPAGVQAARLTGTMGVFDTDDGSAVGVHFKAAKPFADIITTPEFLREDYGKRHRRYPGFKALAYLHPNRFTPDSGVRTELGLAPDEPLFLLRFSSYTASHDATAKGIPMTTKRMLVEHLTARGRVIISDEGGLPAEFAHLGSSIPPHRLHDILAAAEVCVGDSQSVAAEAAILGTPTIGLSSFGRADVLRVLEDRYGLMNYFSPGQEAAFFEFVKIAVSNIPKLRERGEQGRTRLLAESVDVTSWYHNLVEELVTSRKLPARS